MTSWISTHGLSIIRSRSALGKKAALSNAQECIIPGWEFLSVLLFSVVLASIETTRIFVGSVHDVHRWPAALTDF